MQLQSNFGYRTGVRFFVGSRSGKVKIVLIQGQGHVGVKFQSL